MRERPPSPTRELSKSMSVADGAVRTRSATTSRDGLTADRAEELLAFEQDRSPTRTRSKLTSISPLEFSFRWNCTPGVEAPSRAPPSRSQHEIATKRGSIRLKKKFFGKNWWPRKLRPSAESDLRHETVVGAESVADVLVGRARDPGPARMQPGDESDAGCQLRSVPLVREVRPVGRLRRAVEELPRDARRLRSAATGSPCPGRGCSRRPPRFSPVRDDEARRTTVRCRAARGR